MICFGSVRVHGFQSAHQYRGALPSMKVEDRGSLFAEVLRNWEKWVSPSSNLRVYTKILMWSPWGYYRGIARVLGRPPRAKEHLLVQERDGPSHLLSAHEPPPILQGIHTDQVRGWEHLDVETVWKRASVLCNGLNYQIGISQQRYFMEGKPDSQKDLGLFS